ncbi:hypothetical protein EDEG_02049 [Edhazardia aedis USNM 41457]|uniref:Uncharacterized protein n=1 Tax=Edhazardia aedis (strain USNM 41457) TaxID=1003232 RepID=J8ZVF3_EDHAE|nr:hypothetical protein EDEG_02049 [Edhazardia aedis USNM 41457]|eukprot:EJW03618.1 hypothetical protein EDEG_02049 [Edhazardia aedis USNM 41457]
MIDLEQIKKISTYFIIKIKSLVSCVLNIQTIFYNSKAKEDNVCDYRKHL